jgi:hypothetical protein
MKLLEVTKKEGQRYKAIFEKDGLKVTVPFGSKDVNFTLTADIRRRDMYRRLHKFDLDSLNPMKPGFLTYFLLYGDSPDLEENLQTYKDMFSL